MRRIQQAIYLKTKRIIKVILLASPLVANPLTKFFQPITLWSLCSVILSSTHKTLILKYKKKKMKKNKK